MEKAADSIMNAFRHSPLRKPAQIFLGDASISIRDLNAALLHRADGPVKTDAGAKTAYLTLHEKSSDLLVIDYKIPGHADLRLIVKMRAVNGILPVVLTSITIDADELNRSSHFKLNATHAKKFTAEQLLELAAAVLQISEAGPVEAPPLALIQSIERRLQSGQPLTLPVRLLETGTDLISSKVA